MAKLKTPSGQTHTNGAPPPPHKEESRQGAYFLSLSLENVRCFGPKQTLDLSDGNGKPARWTILLGLNGTGKTTILQCLAILGELSRPDRNVADTSRKSRTLLDIGSFLFKNTLAGRSSKCSSQLSLSAGLSNPNPVSGDISVEAKEVTSFRCSLDSKTHPVFGYGAARRMGAAAFGVAGTDDSTATLFSDKADLRNPEDWLLWLDYSAAKAKENKALRKARLQEAIDVILGVMPEGELSDIRFVMEGDTHPKGRVEFQTPYGWVPMRQLGFGYQTLITWVADFANRMVERYPNSKNPLHEPAVCLVDEIDLHLHPIWQRKLMGFLSERFPNTQFIATAHSPLVAQAAAKANLAVLRREGDHVVIDNDVDNIRNWRVDQILTSELFGLKTARPPHIEDKLEERKELLSKPKLTASDHKRVQELDVLIGELPFGETDQDRRERAQILKTLDRLTKESPAKT